MWSYLIVFFMFFSFSTEKVFAQNFYKIKGIGFKKGTWAEPGIKTSFSKSNIKLKSYELSKKFCRYNSDCACGVDKETGECAYGNKKFIDTSRQCQDFCTGIHGRFRIKCVDNLCKAVFLK